MVERNALYFHLDAHEEGLPELYMDGLGHLSVETVQRMLVFTQSLLDRPKEPSALEVEWEEWWPLTAVFVHVYAPQLGEYRALSPLTYESSDGLSPADVRYFDELKKELHRYISDRDSDVYTYWPEPDVRKKR